MSVLAEFHALGVVLQHSVDGLGRASGSFAQALGGPAGGGCQGEAQTSPRSGPGDGSQDRGFSGSRPAGDDQQLLRKRREFEKVVLEYINYFKEVFYNIFNYISEILIFCT